MHITIADKEETSLNYIDAGAVFKCNGEYYMKLRYESTDDLPQYDTGACPTAICLEDGTLVCLAETTPVESVDAELRVKE